MDELFYASFNSLIKVLVIHLVDTYLQEKVTLTNNETIGSTSTFLFLYRTFLL